MRPPLRTATVAGAALFAGLAIAEPETLRVSDSELGAQGDFLSSYPSISPDGRFVAFESAASNLVPDDGNQVSDVFLRDMQTGAVTRLSLDAQGGDAADTSYRPVVSARGKFVAFHSDAPNLVESDGNAARDVFVRDVRRGVTVRVSLDAQGGDPNNTSSDPSISADGRVVAYTTFASDVGANDFNGTLDVFVLDRKKGRTERVSVATDDRAGNGPSFAPAISGNGRFVAFQSGSDTLGPGDTNSAQDIYVRDRKARTTTRVSVATGGGQAVGGNSSDPSISANGRFVAFESDAGNLVEGDGNNVGDIFVHDRKTGVTTRVSVSSDGTEANAGSFEPSISGDGRFVAFHSRAGNLVADDGNAVDDVFLHDRTTGETVRVSVDTSGAQAGGHSTNPSVSSDGSAVAFDSVASNLVTPDANGWLDVFLRRLR